MIIKQLTVFLESKTGGLAEVSSILGEALINMSAFSITDSADYGMLRLIVTEPEKAMEILKEKGFFAQLTDVLCMTVPNVPGALSNAMRILMENHVSIQYMYAYSLGEDALSIIKPNSIELCMEVLQAHKLELIASSSIYGV